MVKRYAAEATALDKTVSISEVTMSHIGQIVRAVAEIDHCLTWYLAALAEMKIHQAVIIFSRTNISSKIELARTFATDRGGDILEKFKEAVGSEGLSDIINARNILSHGAYIGSTTDGALAFRLLRHIGVDGTKAAMEVSTFTQDQIKQLAAGALSGAKDLPAFLSLDIRSLEGIESLDPHPKSAQARR